jgi:hypothetical protein
MKSSKLIGIGGRLSSGKDAVADHLVAKHGFVKIGMSDPLLKATLAINPTIWVGSSFHAQVLPNTPIKAERLVDAVGYVEAKRYPDFRVFMQRLGTDFGRQMVSKNVWVDMADDQIFRLQGDGHDVVVTGIRFGNELKLIHQNHGRSWWIDRPQLADARSDNHASENGVQEDEFDIVVRNNRTLDYLYQITDRVLKYSFNPSIDPRSERTQRTA